MSKGPGLHRRVLDGLGGSIASGEHPPLAVLRIEQLEAQFAVSRTVIREAIRVLESMQLVEVRRRVGVIIRPREDWNIYDPLVIRWRLASSERAAQLNSLTELRSAIEPTAAFLAAQRASPEQCADLTEAVIGMVTAGKLNDLNGYLKWDIDFHRTILAASGNEMFARLGDAVAEVLSGRTRHGLMPAHPDPAAISLHVDLAAAIRSGEADQAATSMREIVVRVFTDVARAFTEISKDSTVRAGMDGDQSKPVPDERIEAVGGPGGSPEEAVDVSREFTG